MTRLAIAIVVVVAGCSKKDAGSCRTDAAELAQFLAGVDRGPVALALGDTTLVERGELPTLTKVAWPSLTLHRAASIDGREVSVDEIGAALAARATSSRDYGLAIDASEAWSRVAAAIHAAKLAGFDRPHFVFARPDKGTPPPRAPIDDQLDTVFAHRRVDEIAALANEAVSRCPALMKAFGSTSASTDKSAEILSQLTPALIDCDCNVDLAGLRSILYRLYSLPRPDSELVTTIEDGAPVVMLPAAMSWRDASQHIDRSATTIDVKPLFPPP
jgi:hypothetical protein